jgi:hypothetical protein
MRALVFYELDKNFSDLDKSLKIVENNGGKALTDI